MDNEEEDADPENKKDFYIERHSCAMKRGSYVFLRFLFLMIHPSREGRNCGM